MSTMPRYRIEEDAPFLPKDIFSQEMYVPGLEIADGSLFVTDKTDVGAFVFAGEYGKC